MLNFKSISDMENPVVRRIAIVLLMIVSIPILSLIFLAELIWESAGAIGKIAKQQFIATKPRIEDLIQDIKELW